MADNQGSVRTTISVPRDLKARMDKVKEPVNWSALACRAFEDKLAEIASRKEWKVMSDVVERLRASVRNEQGESFNAGYELGRAWVMNAAEAPQLKRMEAFRKAMKTKSSTDWESWFWIRGNYKPWLELVAIIRDDKNLRAYTALGFWKELVGEPSTKPDDGDFLRGFVDGAVDLWVEVQEQL
jgi:hypothetical protein